MRLRLFPNQINIGMPALGAQQVHGFIKERLDRASLPSLLADFSKIKKPLQMSFEQLQLAQSHLDRLGIGLAVELACVHLKR